MEDGEKAATCSNLLAFVESQEIGRAHHATIQSSPMKKERHQAAGLTIGERLQHDAVDDGENGRIGAASKGEREHSNQRETRILPKHADGESEILEQRFKKWKPPLVAATFLGLLDAT